jgi:hypothetical protein
MLRKATARSVSGSRLYGGLKDSDRIFTNLYDDGDRHLKGAIQRVRKAQSTFYWREKEKKN